MITMIATSIGLLLLLVPIKSYLKANQNQHYSLLARLVNGLSKKSINCNPQISITALYDGENPSAETINPLLQVQQPVLRGEQRFPIANRNDNIKAKNLLTKDWEFPNAIQDIRCYLSVNESFVPVIGVHKKATFIKLRSYLFGQGVYPGVEYKILKIDILRNNSSDSIQQEVQSLQGLLQRGRSDVISDNENNWISRLFSGQTQLIQTSGSDSSIIINSSENAAAGLSSYRKEEDFIELTVRPAYPLIKELEKKWPVKVRLSAVPYVFSRAMYTTVTLLGTLSFALTYFLGALLLTQVFTLSFVNSRSMTPTILPGDLILVEKISPIVRRALFHIPPASEGDVVFFSAPPRLLEYIEESNTPLKETVRGGIKKSVSEINNARKITTEKTDEISFNKQFLTAQQNIVSSSTAPAADVDGGEKDKINIKPPTVVVIDKNPFHYRNLRPIGGNTLLVKRLASISYPESDLLSRQEIENVVGENKLKVSSITKGTSNGLLKVEGSKEEKKGPVCLFVRGDNPDVSLDSRQWGCLDEDLVIGRPIFTVLPLKRFGFVK